MATMAGVCPLSESADFDSDEEYASIKSRVEEFTGTEEVIDPDARAQLESILREQGGDPVDMDSSTDFGDNSDIINEFKKNLEKMNPDEFKETAEFFRNQAKGKRY